MTRSVTQYQTNELVIYHAKLHYLPDGIEKSFFCFLTETLIRLLDTFRSLITFFRSLFFLFLQVSCGIGVRAVGMAGNGLKSIPWKVRRRDLRFQTNRPAIWKLMFSGLLFPVPLRFCLIPRWAVLRKSLGARNKIWGQGMKFYIKR